MSVNIELLREELTYSTTASIAAVEEDFREIAEIEKKSQEEVRHFQGRKEETDKFGNLFILIALVCFWWGVFAGFGLADAKVLLFFMLLTGVAIVCSPKIYKQSKEYQKQVNYYSRYNLSSSSRYKLFERMVKLWKGDINDNEKLKIGLFLSKIDENIQVVRQQLVRQSTHPIHPNRQIDFYRETWLKVKSRFADGTRFFLEVTEEKIVCTWRNENNKNRNKNKRLSEISLILKCPDIYQALPRLEDDALEAVKLPETVILKRLEIAPSRMVIKVKVPHKSIIETPMELLYQTIAMMHLSAYQILNLARILTQQQSA